MRLSMRSMLDYRISAIDGDVGTLYDYYVQKNSRDDWSVPYLVADTTSRWRGIHAVAFPTGSVQFGPDTLTKIIPVRRTVQDLKQAPAVSLEPRQGGPLLFSFRHLLHYTVETNDGHYGRVDDCLVDDQTWRIPYFIMKTGTILAGREIALAPRWIARADDANDRLFLGLSGLDLERGPHLDPHRPPDPAFEQRYDRFYDQA